MADRSLHAPQQKTSVAQPLSRKLRRELEAAFREDVRLLECLIDRDLFHWIPSARPVAQRGPKAA